MQDTSEMDFVTPPDDFKLLSESIGFCPGNVPRRFKVWAVYVMDRNGKIYLRSPKENLYWKTRRNAEQEAKFANRIYSTVYDRKLEKTVMIDPDKIMNWAFAREIEVTERVIG